MRGQVYTLDKAELDSVGRFIKYRFVKSVDLTPCLPSGISTDLRPVFKFGNPPPQAAGLARKSVDFHLGSLQRKVFREFTDDRTRSPSVSFNVSANYRFHGRSPLIEKSALSLLLVFLLVARRS
jgi:hypothetical protein